ncbi:MULTISPECIES: conjugative transposon protein TraM [Bacteroidales]|uniref:Conjugative transposon protein TraM n=1 Tax=Parabacteroides merdae TaxID=46503 RepID=A0ABW9SKI3_9BACT|nr:MULTISPECIES: conjugative transposon protein TraM [Parabacteroides]MBU9002683.1 conjugative transposon protein TraM [Parabacteroides sp. MSK.9.14]MTU37903.1 conjugative transposon protein TraM [Parabacteroides merdae]MTU42004.1 conjugative transposon protein TraM [Parabacteroides merdae]MTU51119.1 conjugative transposon protein TraM [Parabacteroides merdae]MTU59524.1 conjugative transposon protein TraM [Parabacteroides merdae]
MMEEQNQEKATATQHVTVADAAAPETGNGKKEDKGGGKKEKKTAKPLTPKQLQQRKKLMVYPLMGLLFLGSMWLIFAPSEERDVNRDTVGAFNADIPLPENDGIIGDKRKAYEQAQAEKVRSLEDFAFSEESDMDGVEMELPDSEPEREPFRDYSDNGGGSRSSVTAYRDINRQLGSFYEEPKVDGEKEELKRQVEELTAKLEERERQAGGIDDQVALMEKSYELAAKYMGQNGKDGAAVQNDNSPRQPAVAVQVARERTVSGLQQPLSDAEFMRRYSQPRNYGFNTAVGSGYTMGKNTIRACIHGDQTIMDGQTVKLRLLEPLQAGNLVIPQNTLVAGTGKVQGERLDIVVSSIEYRGNLLPVELAVYDSDGQKGLSVPSSLEQEAAKEAMANIGGGLGTSISFARSAGQQVAMDITRGLMQGGSQYLAKKFRTVKVHLKAGYELMLYAKQQ